MIRSYFRDITNSLRRTAIGSVINIFGMSVGIALFMLIMLYVRSETNVNKGFKEYHNIYRISRGDGTSWQGTPARLGEILSDDLPEVSSFCRIDVAGRNNVVKVNNTPFNLGKLVYADSTFFRMFELPFIFGDRENALSEQFAMVITEDLSRRLFGNDNPVGRKVLLNGKSDIQISGVVRDFGHETHIDGDAFLSFHSMPTMRNRPDLYDCYTCYNYETYLLLLPELDISKITIKINKTLDNFGTDHSIESLIVDEYSLTSLENIYFGQEERPSFRKGNASRLKVLSAVAFMILVIALINYVNMATAQAGSRTHDLAIRKAMGASKTDLFISVIGEALLISLISVNAGLLIMELVKPFFNSIFGTSLRIGYLDNPSIILIFLLAAIIIGFLAGIYPALYITRLDSKDSLQSEMTRVSGGGRVRRILTMVQVIMSITLIASTAIIYGQLKYIDNSDLGFDKEVLMYLDMNTDLNQHKEAFRNELLAYNGIENVSYSYASYRTHTERWGFEYNDKDALMHIEAVDKNYIETLGLDLIKGRNFRGSQDVEMMIVNEEACDRYFGNDPVGVRIESIGEKAEIVGVVKNYSFESFHNQIEPIALVYRERWLDLCNVRLSGAEVSGSIEHIESLWDKFCPDFPFEYHFVDALYESKYNEERNIGQLLIFFSLSSVVIACLGIFGLVTFSVMKRSREVGIRKVNGASTVELVKMLSSEITVIVLLSVIPAFLIIALVMSKWLSGFAYHINIPIIIYPLSALVVWIIAMLSTIGRTLKTARIQPSDVLRAN